MAQKGKHQKLHRPIEKRIIPGKNGGWRPGGGRKPGNSWHKKDVRTYRQLYPILPLDFMLSVLNNLDPHTKKPKKFKYAEHAEMAKAAAPLVHPRLSSIVDPDTLKNAMEGRYSIDITKLSDIELAQLEQIMLKAGLPMLPAPEANGEIIEGEVERED